jgi:signal transduction histidine kinase
MVEQTGATEIYLNGKLIEKYGHLSNEQAGVQAVSPSFGEFISLQPGTQGEQILAVRFALQKGIPYVLFVGNPNRALALKIITIKGVTRLTRNEVYFLDYVKASLFFILTLLHLVLFLFSPERKANLYFFIFSVMSMLNFFLHAINTQYVHLVSLKMLLLIFYSFLYISSSFFFLLATYSVFRQSRGLVFRILTVAFLLTIPLFLWSYRIGWWLSLVLYPILAFLESARIALLADQKKMRGARVVTYGAISFLFFYPLFHAIFFGLLPAGPNSLFQHMAFNLGILSLPVSISIYLATEASFTSRSLATKLVEVEQLSERTLIQEEEKKHLQQMDELKSHFFANISHEFRTPLSLIRGTVEQLIKKDSDPLQRQSGYRAIDHSASRLLQMINQLLDLSRLESGKLPLHLQPGNLSALLKLLGGSFASLYESKGITYRYTVPLQPVWVQLDREKLEQIINNLLSNAAKFTQAKGQVNFTATIHTLDTHTCSLHILVQDTGIGIPTTQLPLIFDRFYQADSSPTRNYEGSGIGLALVKELVALHGGKIEVERQLVQVYCGAKKQLIQS